MRFYSLILSIMLCFVLSATAQRLTHFDFTRADTLRGSLSPLRSCYDVNYYHLDVKLDISNKRLSGSNTFLFTATENFSRLQFDLFDHFHIERVQYGEEDLKFSREYNAVYIDFPQEISKGARDSFTVYYSGKPIIAQQAPWGGGFVFSTDSNGKPWVATACQGLGASSWWPCKDHQSDEPDSMLISASVPEGLVNVSNGRLKKSEPAGEGYVAYHWFVSEPINTYNVALNIGDYQHLNDSYQGEKGILSLDYWILKGNEAKARKQFSKNVKPMLQAFEYWFGPYPFYKDGYKLVETPYLGMEHQTAIAYGNGFRNGYKGKDLSDTGWGAKWDFIIVHESGHEWFGNSITAKDIADMWIHESFTNYSESLFVESLHGKRAGQEYLHGLRQLILNDRPVTGFYNVNHIGSSDMYYKGSNMLNIVRSIINDDEKWRSILRGLNSRFFHQTVTAQDIISYINKASEIDFSKVFEQYLRYTRIPELQLRYVDGKVMARWKADVPGFSLPLRIRKKGQPYQLIELNDRFQPLNIPGLSTDNVEVDIFNYYIRIDVK